MILGLILIAVICYFIIAALLMPWHARRGERDAKRRSKKEGSE